jgi:hypothetical protein
MKMKLIKSVPAKREGRINHTIRINDGMTIVIQTTGHHGAGRAKPATIWMGDESVSKKYDGRVITSESSEARIIAAARLTLPDDAPYIGADIHRAYNCLSAAAERLVLESKRGEMEAAIMRSLDAELAMSLRAGDDVWPAAWAATYAQKIARQTFKLALSDDDAAALAARWMDALPERERCQIAA